MSHGIIVASDRSRYTASNLHSHVPQFIELINWLPNSLDMNLVDFIQCRELCFATQLVSSEDPRCLSSGIKQVRTQ